MWRGLQLGARWLSFLAWPATWIKPLCALIVLACVPLVLDDLWIDATVAAHEWQQGDWLIHNLLGPVRRGPIGSGLVTLADALTITPLVVVLWLQLALFAVLLILWTRVWRGLPPVFWLLLVLPAALPQFWGNMMDTALRKDVLGYIAILLVLGFEQRWSIWLALLIYAVAAFGHEVNIIITPVLALVIWLRAPQRALLPLAILGWLALMATVYVLRFPQPPEGAVLCEPLIQRGLDPQLCKGALRWISLDREQSFGSLSGWLLSPPRIAQTLLGAGLTLGSWLWMVHRAQGWQRSHLWLLAALTPQLVLYVVAVDWNRWINLHVTSGLLGLVALYRAGWFQPTDVPRFWPLFLGLNLLWCFDTTTGIASGLIETLLWRFIL